MGFTDMFPIASVHEDTSTFFLRDGGSAGALLRLPSCNSSQMRRLSQVLSDYLRNTPLVSQNAGLTVTLYKKTSPVEIKGEDGEIIHALKSEGLLAIVASSEKTRRGIESVGLFSTLKGILGVPDNGLESQLINAVQSASVAAEELCDFIGSAGLKCERVRSGEAMVSTAKYFWSAAREKAAVLRAGDGSCDAMGSFADKFTLVARRLLWKEGDSMRVMSSMRTPPTEPFDAAPQSAQDTQDKTLASIFGMEDTGMPGLLVIVLSAGGSLAISESVAVSGSLIAKIQTAMWHAEAAKSERDERHEHDDDEHKPSESELRAKAKLAAEASRRARKAALSGETRTLRVAALHLSSLSWQEEMTGSFGTFSEAASVTEHERVISNSLASCSGGADWLTIDTMWLETYYALIPGATRLDHPAASTLFDVFHLL